ncbi:MAG: hypothetical protein VYC34_04290 [Planctomycetota bacterium]|nr:hypothetical protein [Planctomycetota bacterium]
MTMVVGLAVAANASATFVGAELRNDPAWDAAATAAIDDGNQYTVVRLYAIFDDNAAADRVVSVGQPDDPINGAFGLNGGGFFQSPLVGDTAPAVGLFGILPEAQWDSYISIGKLVDDSATTPDPDFDFVDQIASDGLEDTVKGGWFNINPANNQGNAQFNASMGAYETFLGQFTFRDGFAGGFGSSGVGSTIFNSDFVGEVTIFTGMPGQAPDRQVVSFAIPAPGALALFGAAGLVGLRRRRA